MPKAEITNCGEDRFASYIYAEYRFIPIKSEDSITLDSNGFSIDLADIPSGVIKSEGYATWKEKVQATGKFLSEDPSKAIRFYITDMDIEDADFSTNECRGSYLELNDKVFLMN